MKVFWTIIELGIALFCFIALFTAFWPLFILAAVLAIIWFVIKLIFKAIQKNDTTTSNQMFGEKNITNIANSTTDSSINTWTCTSCGKTNEDGLFCRYCGKQKEK